tara:strand:- start:253 stop:831 length:579 start_codon:yes stop_codon:yes gene_type:complete
MADEVYELGVPKAQVVDAGAYMPASSTLDPDEEDSKPSWAQKWEDDKTKLERLKGLCVTWNKKGGWGFIKRDDGLDDIFVHQRSIHLTGYRSLLIGEQVEFDVQMGSETQKLEAVNVTGPGGIEVRSSLACFRVSASFDRTLQNCLPLRVFTRCESSLRLLPADISSDTCRSRACSVANRRGVTTRAAARLQ